MPDDFLRSRSTELYDPQAERAVLAAALLDAGGTHRIVPRLASIVSAEDFYDPRHATLWEVFLAVHARGEPLDVLTVVAELRARERLNTVGGAQYVGELTDEIPTLAHCEAHAGIVQGYAVRRRALESVQAAATRLRSGESVDAIGADVQKTLRGGAGMGGARRVGGDMPALTEKMTARAEGREKPLATPWATLSRELGGGLWPGMYVLVGGTGAGKTQWAVQLAVEAAQSSSATALYLALELSREDIAARVVGDLAGVPWSRVLRGRLKDEELDPVARAMRAAEALALYTECGVPFGYGPELLQARAWTLRPQLIVLDFLQLCAGRQGEDARTTVGRVSYIARSIARDLGAVVLVLSSTARANYADLVNDPEKDPADLVGLGKESGEIEYAADGVLVLAKHKDDKDRRTLVIAKHRHGPTGRVDLHWSGTTFTEATESAPEGAPVTSLAGAFA